MATYPSDATITTASFSTITTDIYSVTGSTTNFNISTVATHPGEVIVTADGIIQDTATYSITNSGATVSFAAAPDVSTLELRVINLPSRFRTVRNYPTTRLVSYSNTDATIVSGNSYVINGETQNFPLPDMLATSEGKESLLVTVSGVTQNSADFDYPATNTAPETTTGSISRNLGTSGITIGQANDTVLLLNFETNFTDESPKARGAGTVVGDVNLNSTKKYGNSSAQFDGTGDYLAFADSADFRYTSDFTIEAFVNFDATGSANTVFSHITDASNFVKLSRLANDTIQFRIAESGTDAIDLQGGSISASTWYHVAVSYESEVELIKLFVDGTKVAEDNTAPITIAPTGNVEIGRIGFGTLESLDGYVDSFRFVNNTPIYKANFATPRTSLTKIHSPLTSADTLVIRHFDASAPNTFDRFNSMADRKPDKGYTTETEFDMIAFESQAGYEKRRLRSRRSKRNFSINYTNISGVEKSAIETFYRARSGNFESFTFDLTHINENGTIQTRFDGPLRISHVLSTGTSLENNFYTVSFNLKEVYD